MITTIATGGAKTIGTALKLTAKSFEELLSLGRRGVKTLGKAPKSFVETIIKLFRSLRRLDVQKHIDDLIDLMVSLFKTTKQVAEEVYKKILNVTERKLFKEMGFVPTSYIDDVLNLCPISK